MRLNQKTAPWTDYWIEAGAAAMLGGARHASALAAHWRGFFESAPAEVTQGPALEVASGSAPVLGGLLALEGKSPCLAVAIDISPSAAALARRVKLSSVVCGADQLPFRPRTFRLVCSQFGIEYAGACAFLEAAEATAPLGVAAFLAHLRGGAIDKECAENARAASIVEFADFLERAREAFANEGAPGTAGDQSFLDAKRTLAELLAKPDRAASRRLLSPLAADIARLVARRRAFDPGEARNWLDSVGSRLESYRQRMRAMAEAALDADAVRGVAAAFSQSGLQDFSATGVRTHSDAEPYGWWITARRPAG